MKNRTAKALTLSLFFMLFTMPSAMGQDTDGDGVNDVDDNCLLILNVNQIDTDLDGFGNACDADYNNDLIVNFLDLARLGASFLTSDPDVDSNGDGVVNFLDLLLLRSQFLGPPGPGALPSMGFTQRPTRIEYDYDNNGIVDGASEFQYDAEGQVIVSEIIETPDGTPDLIRIMRENSVTTITYDTEGNLDTLSQDFEDPASFDNNIEYEYDVDNVLLRVDQSNAISSSYSLFVYDAEVAVSSDTFLLADDTPVGSILYTYDEDGLFDTSFQTSMFGDFAIFDYDWGTDGKVTRRRLTPDTPDHEVIDFVRVAGRLESRIFTNSAFTSPPQNYVENYVYDETSGRLDEIRINDNSDGIFEAVFTVFWEDGPCQLIPNAIVTVVPVETGGNDGDLDSPIGELNLCGF